MRTPFRRHSVASSPAAVHNIIQYIIVIIIIVLFLAVPFSRSFPHSKRNDFRAIITLKPQPKKQKKKRLNRRRYYYNNIRIENFPY